MLLLILLFVVKQITRQPSDRRIFSSDETSAPVHSQQTASASNGKPSIIPVSTQSPLSPTVAITTPVRDDPNPEPSCDSYGVCYEVSLKCTDTRIVVNVRTSRPFHGRIYALGRSETCNSHIRNSQQFALDMSLGGQDCNTQSLVTAFHGVHSISLHFRSLSLLSLISLLDSSSIQCSLSFTFEAMKIKIFSLQPKK